MLEEEPELPPVLPSSGVLAGLDIGGTLSKCAIYLSPSESASMATNLRKFIESSDRYGSTGRRDAKFDFKTQDGGSVFFVKYGSHRSLQAIQMMRKHNLLGPGAAIGCTGGGATKFSRLFQHALKVGWKEVDEMESLVAGITFLIQQVPKSIFCLRQEKEEDKKLIKEYLPIGTVTQPSLLVNIGSGVSILLLEGPSRYRRVGGSPLGGATFYGLARLLSDCASWREALELASKGDSTKVDLLVGDIYGGHYTKLGLSADMIAAYFGKMVSDAKKDGPTPADKVAALLKLITYSVGSTAWLYARIYRPKHIIFTGNFLRKNALSQHRINYMVRTLSGGRVKALFMERQGYFGAIGAMLRGQEIQARPSAFDQDAFE